MFPKMRDVVRSEAPSARLFIFRKFPNPNAGAPSVAWLGFFNDEPGRPARSSTPTPSGLRSRTPGMNLMGAIGRRFEQEITNIDYTPAYDAYFTRNLADTRFRPVVSGAD